MKQSLGFVKDIFKSAFSNKPNSTYTSDDLVKDDNMLQVEAHRHFMDYGSDYLALEMGLFMLSNIQMTVVDKTQVVNIVTKEMQREIEETTSNHGYYADRSQLLMLTLKKPIENLCEEDISLKEFELFLGKLLSLAVPKVVLCEKRKRLVLLCLQILANETVVDTSLLKLTTLYMNKLKEGGVLKNMLFEKEAVPGCLNERTTTVPRSTTKPNSLPLIKQSCILVTDKSPNKLETDLSFAHYGCKFNIVMDDPKKDDMERISIEARHKYDGEPTKVLNELIVYVTKSPTFAFRHLGGRAAKYEIATSSEHVIGIVMYVAEFNKGRLMESFCQNWLTPTQHISYIGLIEKTSQYPRFYQELEAFSITIWLPSTCCSIL